MFKTIIAGSRDISISLENFSALLDQLFEILGYPQFIISGCARGIDKLGEVYAESRQIAVIPFPADWDNLGKAAGHIRNKQMAMEADSLIAFWDGSSSGTKSMIRYASERQLSPIVVINFKLNTVEFL